jgi:hypothetical protein
VDVENIGLAQPHKLWPDNAWTDIPLQNARCVADRGTTILNTLQQFLCSIHHQSVMSPKEKIKGIQVWRMTWAEFWSLPFYPSPSVGSLKVISGSATELGWGITMH